MKESLAGKLDVPRSHLIGWYLAALLTGAGLVVSLPGYYSWFVRQPFDMQFNGFQTALTLTSGFASLFCALISFALAAIIFLRKPGDRFATFVSLFLLAYGFVVSGPLEMVEHHFFHQMGVLSVHLQVILLTAPSILLFLTFPNGVVVPGSFRWIILAIIPVSLALGLLPSEEINSIVTWRSQLLYFLLGVLFLLSQGAQVYRYLRKSTPVERQQTKIAVYGLGMMFLLMFIDGIIYFQIPDNTKGTLDPNALHLNILWYLSLAILPVSFTLAVIRSHLWDIDFLIRRTLIYGLLTSILVLLYFSGVVLVQSIIQLIIGHSSPVAILISTLAVAGLFHPLRTRIQSLIDRHFFRSKYDFEHALAGFQLGMRGRVHLAEVESDLINIVQSTLQPESIALWIRDKKEELDADKHR